MQYRKLGHTDIEVSVVAFGAWAIVGDATWGQQNREDAIAAIRAAYDSGVNFFDTAETYGNGESERILAEALPDIRDNIVIATKVSSQHFNPAQIRQSCEKSIKNLRTDHIDLLQLHWPQRDIPIGETVNTLDGLRKEGKIRAYGVSNFGETSLAEILASGRTIASNQMAYNLLFRAIEFKILPICREHNIALLCYSTLMQGLLTGKFKSAEEVPEGRARTRLFSSARKLTRHATPGFENETFRAIEQIRAVALELGLTMNVVSLAWLLAQPGVTSTIAGARNPDQAIANARAGDLVLDPIIVRNLSIITDALKQKLGTNADMWQKESRVW